MIDIIRKKKVKLPYAFGLLLIMSFLAFDSFGQVQKFGKIGKREVEDIVTESSAEMIFDYGLLSVKEQLTYELYRHKRIKINTRDGIEWATFSILFDEEEGQLIKDIEGMSYTLNEKGKIEKTKLNEAEIFSEDLPGGLKRIKFTLPNVKEGSVVEIRYTHKIGHPTLLPNWTFDNTIPVRWSELEADIPSILRFSLISKVKKELHINDAKDKTIKFKWKFESDLEQRGNYGSSGSSGSSSEWLSVKGQRFRWALKDMPALEEEPNVASLKNYYSKMFLEFSALSIPNQTYLDFARSWENISEDLDESRWFGEQLRSEDWSKSLVNTLIAPNDNADDKISKIYSYVKSYAWTGLRDFYVDEDLEKVFEAKAGNSAELNLMLVKLFREAGFYAHPVLISTRDNGLIIQDYVLPSQFNHVIVRVGYEDTTYLLDVLNPYNSVMLPKYDLNGEGLVIHKYEPEWVQLDQIGSNSSILKYDIDLASNGNMKGELSITAKGYDALAINEELQRSGKEAYFKDKLSSEFDGALNGEISTTPSFYEPKIEMKLDFESKGFEEEATAASNVIYLSPITPKLLTDNPFTNEVRALPIEFPNTFTRTSQVKIKLPEGYEVESLPEVKNMALPRRALSYLESYSVDDGAIVIIRRLQIRTTQYPVAAYPIIKEVFEDASTDANIRLVLKKSDAK